MFHFKENVQRNSDNKVIMYFESLLYCRYEDELIDRAYTTGPATYDIIYESTLWHDAWSSHFILCSLPQR